MKKKIFSHFNNANVHPVLLTKEGLEKLKKENELLVQKRPSILEELKRAREMGDLSENGAYKAAKMSLGQIDARLRFLHRVLLRAQVIEKTVADTIGYGSELELEINGIKRIFTLVGVHEANPSEGKISDRSPLGKLLFGKKEGNIVELDTPKGKKAYQILKIS